MKIKTLLFTFLLAMSFLVTCYAEQAPKLPPPIPGTNITFYVAINGKQAGPFDMVTLRGMAQTYQINSFTLVWREGMDAWTQASLVPEMQQIFGKSIFTKNSHIVNNYSENSSYSGSADYNPSDIQAADNQKPLTEKEQQFITEKLHDKWNVDPTDKKAMKATFNKNLASGIAMASVGTVLQSVGAGVMGGLVSSSLASATKTRSPSITPIIIGTSVGGSLLLAGTIIGPLCAVGFVYTGRTGNVYKKINGKKLFSFLERTNFNGGYDWENKEVCLAMGIRL